MREFVLSAEAIIKRPLSLFLVTRMVHEHSCMKFVRCCSPLRTSRDRLIDSVHRRRLEVVICVKLSNFLGGKT